MYTRVVEGPANSALVGRCPVDDRALLDGLTVVVDAPAPPAVTARRLGGR